MRAIVRLVLVGAAFVAPGCGLDPVVPITDTDTDGGSGDATGGPADLVDVDALGNACVAVLDDADQWLTPSATGTSFAFAAGEMAGAGRFFLKASDLGTYLLYDQEGGYLVAEDGPLLRQTSLESDAISLDDTFVSGAEWELQLSARDPARYQLRHRKTGQFLAAAGLTANESDAAAISLEPATDCRNHPELSVDAEGQVMPRMFDDGSLYGIVDTHSHILSNFAFGGGSIFHGAPFHRLGVEHALGDCEPFHGPAGRADFFGYAFDTGGADGLDISALLPALLAGGLDVDNHATAGYPEFTDWPNGPSRSTHQTQYYRWLERAYLSGLRLVVQHATTNSVICDMTAGQGLQRVRYSCNDMVAVDRILDEVLAMERYIDAQSGGEGQGWFRIVRTPAEAREVIAGGKMAVVLGIETSDLFDCKLTPGADSPVCDEAYVKAQLDAYYERGIRVLFPVHKYDNAFSAGDGDRAFIELGNFFNSGHWSNFTLDCPADSPAVFDKGDVAFGGLNMPRDVYDSPAPLDFSGFPAAPLGTAFQYIGQIQEPPLVGDYCQNAGLTPLGETLLTQMMARGMIIEVDHLPQRSYERAFELLEANDYPAAGTHGTNSDGRIYALGGVSKTGLGRCREAARPGAMLDRLQERIALIEANGGYPAEGFGFDLNGFAGAPGPRFGKGACPDPQEDPITYPFSSYAGDVTFTQPYVGNRAIDFNTEGMVHIGLLPELLEDARRDAVSEADLEPLFRSAEGYIRMWERAEQRAAALNGG
jgi:microsomal dipeptidase-like Zn-dependent dipeptidase